MKPQDSETIAHLNKILKNELTAINQYFLHSRMLKNWGLHRLAHHAYEESIDEMKHADTLTERILLLEGLPNVQDIGRIHIGENPMEILQCDLDLEMAAMPMLRHAIEHAETKRDYISREIYARILESEEEHVDWLETQLELISRVSLENYLQEQMHTTDD